MKLRYLLPFIGPFVFLGMARALWFLAGAPWNDPASAAGVSLVVGVFLGVVAVHAMNEAPQ